MLILRKSTWEQELHVRGLLLGSLAIVSTVLVVPHSLTAQHSNPSQMEQSEFSYELEVVPIQRPVTLPRAALEALSKDELIASCLENERLSPEELPANWFVASEIHLSESSQGDFVVLPGGPLPDTPENEISPNACLVGANTAQMWVLRRVHHDFRLVLSQMALGMGVLTTRTNGFRDIEVGAVVGGGYDESIKYKFDGHSYKIAARTFKLIGAEPPRTLAVFRTRKTLIQSATQTSEGVRSDARAWLWHQWQERQSAYIKVTVHDKASEETSSYFIATGEKGDWQVTIQVHRIIHDDNATASQQHISERELLVATLVQRVEPTAEETEPAHIFSDNEILPVSQYRLRFLDYGNRTVGTL